MRSQVKCRTEHSVLKISRKPACHAVPQMAEVKTDALPFAMSASPAFCPLQKDMRVDDAHERQWAHLARDEVGKEEELL